MEALGCILIEDDPLAIKQITEYVNNNVDLKYTINDMDVLYTSISTIKPIIVFLDFFWLGEYQLKDILNKLPKKSIIIVTSTIPLAAYPPIRKYLSKFRYYELNKPFSSENFKRCIDEVITELCPK